MSYTYRVLVVEDHALQRQYIQDVFAQAGFSQIDAVEGGRAALQALDSAEYQLVLLDLDMPDMDGMQFIQEMSFFHRDVYLAISSACVRSIMDSAVLMAKSRQLDVLGCYPKPFELKHAHELAQQIQSRQAQASRTERARLALPAMDKASLQRALDQGEIVPWFQPKRSLETDEVAGVEALARWAHPELGIIPPGVFLQNIARHSLVRELLFSILRQTLQAHLAWAEHGFVVPVSVNLPTHLLDDVALPDDLLNMVTEHQILAKQVTFELLETSLTTEASQLLMGAGRLRLKGFLLAQDDFGIGYSSMQALTTVPFTELKIDRSFVAGAAHEESLGVAVRTSINLGKQLGLLVTAEGVETQDDVDFLRSTACDYIQGYFVSKPVTQQALLALLGG